MKWFTVFPTYLFTEIHKRILTTVWFSLKIYKRSSHQFPAREVRGHYQYRRNFSRPLHHWFFFRLSEFFFYPLLDRARFGAGVEQPFGYLIAQNRQAVQSMGRSMNWTLEDNMVDGLFFCATLTSHRGGHTPFVQAGVETSNTGTETVTPDPCSSWEASCVCTRWAGMRWVEQMSRLHGTACQSSVPSKIFVSRPVSKKCHQDQKKLRRPLYIFLKCVHFQRKYLSSIIVGEWLKRM